jgi:hypothetical protein
VRRSRREGEAGKTAEGRVGPGGRRRQRQEPGHRASSTAGTPSTCRGRGSGALGGGAAPREPDRGSTRLSDCMATTTSGTGEPRRKRSPPDRPHNPWGEASRRAECGTPACSVRHGGSWRRAHGEPNRARSWKRRTRPRRAYGVLRQLSTLPAGSSRRTDPSDTRDWGRVPSRHGTAWSRSFLEASCVALLAPSLRDVATSDLWRDALAAHAGRSRRAASASMARNA